MTVTDLSVYFVFSDDPTQTTITRSIIASSVSITKQMLNDLHASSNTCTLQLKQDGTDLIERLINTPYDVLANVVDRGGDVQIFNGVLSKDHSWRVSQTGEDVFQIKIEDYTTRYFNMPYASEDGTFINDTLANVVLSIFNKCKVQLSLSWSSSVTSEIKNTVLVNKIDSSLTCKDMLDQICYEYGLVYYVSGYKTITIKKIDITSQPSIDIGTTDDTQHDFTPDYYLYTEGGSGIDLTRKARQYSQAKVSYSTISDDGVNRSPIYEVTDKIDVPAGGWWDGATHTENIYEPTLDEYFLADKKYYIYDSDTSAYVQATIYDADDTEPGHEPKVNDLVPNSPTYYEYAGQSSLIDMVDSAKGKDILYVYPETITPNTTQTAAVPGYVEKQEVTPSEWTIKQHGNTDKLEILIDNTAGSLSAIYSKFKCTGRVVRKQGTSNIYRSLEGLTSNSETQFNYEAQWLHNKDDAIALCELLSNYYLYCDNTYTFYCIDDLELGQVVRVYENLYSGLDVKMLLTAKQYTAYGTHAGLYKYTAQGISQFDLTSTTRVEKYEAPDAKPTMVGVTVQYATDSQGTTPPSSGWSDTIPVATAGVYIWTWTQYKYSDGSVSDEYSVSYTGDVEYQFLMNLNTNTIITDLRRYESQPIRMTFTKTGYTENIRIRGWYDIKAYDENLGDPDFDNTITDNIWTWWIQYNAQHQYLYIRAELVNRPTVYREVLLKFEDVTQKYYYAGEFDIDTSDYFDSEGNLIPENFSLIHFGPVNLAISDHFGWNTGHIEGDSFFNNHHETDFDDVYVYVWQFDKWVPINFSTFSNSEKSLICGQAQKDVLSTIKPGTVTKSDYGYFNNIIAGMITTDYLGSREIELHDGGFLYGGAVDINLPPGQRTIAQQPGFCFDSQGNGELSNIRITGTSTVEGQSTILGTMTNYDNNGDLVFKTVKENTNITTLSGSRVDGTSAPSAYLWSDFYSIFHNYASNLMSDRVTYTASGTVNGTWTGDGTISSRSIIGARRLASAASTTGTTTRYDCSSGFDHDETRVIYTNNEIHRVKLSQVYVYAKTVQEPTGFIGPLGWGYVHAYVYDANDVLQSTIVNFGEGTGRGGGQYRYAYNVEVPPGGYIEVEWGEGDTWWIQSETHDGYATYTIKESDNFSQGVNLITSDGNIYNTANIFPNTNDYGSYSQVLSLPSVSNFSINMTMTAASNWICQKYYNFTYSQSPGVTSTVTTSILNSQSFSYAGVTYTVSSITYDNSNLKVTTDSGYVFEFSTSGYGNANYYRQYSFNFVAATESLGAYARTISPTDDSNSHDIGGSGWYSSGVPQRWDNGYFDYLNAFSIDTGWHVPIITSNHDIADDIPINTVTGQPIPVDNYFPVGTMRPYFVNSSSTVSLTMPGDSSQQYVAICHNVVDSALVSAGKVNRYEAVAGGASLSVSWTSSAEPYMLIEVLRIA